MGNTYSVRGREWCANSNTVPSMAEHDGAEDSDGTLTCSECGRSNVRVTKHGLIAMHMPARTNKMVFAP